MPSAKADRSSSSALRPRLGPLASTEPASPPRSVLIIGSEALPFAKTGGLADVLGALPPALARLGWDVTVVAAAVPRRHRGRRSSSVFRSASAATRATSGSSTRRSASGARALLVDVPGPVRSRAAVRRRQRRLPRQPAPLRAARARGARMRRASAARARRSSTRTTGRRGSRRSICRRSTRRIRCSAACRAVFTIHNLAYQGAVRRRTGCRGSISAWDAVRDRSARVLGPHQLSEGRHQRRRRRSRPSARATREEIQTPEFGFGFDGILRARARRSRRHPERHRHRREWDPAHDPYLPAPFSADDLAGKARREGARCWRATACRPTTRRWRGRSSG